MTSILFIAGTDTSVGKTGIAARLLGSFRKRGVDARYFKPVQSGARRSGGDTAAVASACPLNQHAVFPALYSFILPAAPHLAAREAGIRLSPARMIRQIHIHKRECELLIVEGAGGLLVPITPSFTVLDLLLSIKAKVILVSRNTLGTLNHTALSLHELRRAGCIPALVVMNSIAPVVSKAERLIRQDNARMVKKMAGGTPVIEVPYYPGRSVLPLLRAGDAMIEQITLG